MNLYTTLDHPPSCIVALFHALTTSAWLTGCPVCQNPMTVIAVIDDPRVVQRILRHLGVWHAPPKVPARTTLRGPYTSEPCDDVDPMPDYENVLTD